MTDEQAFADFVRHPATTLYRYGYVLAGNNHDADDLVQEALIRLRAHWSKVVRKDDPVGYVRTTMARPHVSVWRRRRKEWLTPAIPEVAGSDPGLDRVDETGGEARVRTAGGLRYLRRRHGRLDESHRPGRQRLR
jgi:DNA-directed RNA polymerase specialized sigma24 family protein